MDTAPAVHSYFLVFHLRISCPICLGFAELPDPAGTPFRTRGTKRKLCPASPFDLATCCIGSCGRFAAHLTTETNDSGALVDQYSIHKTRVIRIVLRMVSVKRYNHSSTNHQTPFFMRDYHSSEATLTSINRGGPREPHLCRLQNTQFCKYLIL